MQPSFSSSHFRILFLPYWLSFYMLVEEDHNFFRLVKSVRFADDIILLACQKFYSTVLELHGPMCCPVFFWKICCRKLVIVYASRREEKLRSCFFIPFEGPNQMLQAQPNQLPKLHLQEKTLQSRIERPTARGPLQTGLFLKADMVLNLNVVASVKKDNFPHFKEQV